MDFSIDPKYDDAGYQYNFEMMLLEAYHLLTSIIAHSSINSFLVDIPTLKETADRPFDDLLPRNGIEMLHRKFYNEEISKRLLYLAATLRTLDERVSIVDKSDKSKTEKSHNKISSVDDAFEHLKVAEIFSIKGRTNAGLRQTCGKILHARRISIGNGNSFNHFKVS